MGIGFFGKLYSKGKKVSPTIKSVTPNVPTTSLQKSLRDLKIQVGKTKGQAAKKKQTLWESKHKRLTEGFTFGEDKKNVIKKSKKKD